MCSNTYTGVFVRLGVAALIVLLLVVQVGKFVMFPDVVGDVSRFTNYMLASLTVLYSIALCALTPVTECACNVRRTSPCFAACFFCNYSIVWFVVLCVAGVYLMSSTILTGVIETIGLGPTLVADTIVHGFQLILILLFWLANAALVRFATRELWHTWPRSLICVHIFGTPTFLYIFYLLVLWIFNLSVSDVYYVVVPGIAGIPIMLFVSACCSGIPFYTMVEYHEMSHTPRLDQHEENAAVFLTDVDTYGDVIYA